MDRRNMGGPGRVARWVVVALVALGGLAVVAGPASPPASAIGRVCPPSSPNCDPE